MPPSPQPDAGRFATTQWTNLVLPAGDPAAGAVQRQALEELLRRYYPALLAHLRCRQRLPDEVAEDLVQGFIAHKVLEYRLLAHVERTKGKFRTFLLTALDRYVIDEQRKQHRAQSLEELEQERGPLPARTALDSSAFDAEWARQTLAEALRRMHAECTSRDGIMAWELFQGRVLGPILEGAPPLSVPDIMRRYGLERASQAYNCLANAKRQFVRCLRSVIAETVGADEAEIDQEIEDLIALLGRSGAS